MRYAYLQLYKVMKDPRFSNCCLSCHIVFLCSSDVIVKHICNACTGLSRIKYSPAIDTGSFFFSLWICSSGSAVTLPVVVAVICHRVTFERLVTQIGQRLKFLQRFASRSTKWEKWVPVTRHIRGLGDNHMSGKTSLNITRYRQICQQSHSCCPTSEWRSGLD